MSAKTMSLKDANTTPKLCQLRRDNWGGKHYWMIRDGGNICIHKQDAGKPSEQEIVIPVRTFNQMVTFYTKQQSLRKAQP